ncbi:MAG: hypothetical protein BJ554DRAFT_5522, partial [Olpidium bornovanus]
PRRREGESWARGGRHVRQREEEEEEEDEPRDPAVGAPAAEAWADGDCRPAEPLAAKQPRPRQPRQHRRAMLAMRGGHRFVPLGGKKGEVARLAPAVGHLRILGFSPESTRGRSSVAGTCSMPRFSESVLHPWLPRPLSPPPPTLTHPPFAPFCILLPLLGIAQKVLSCGYAVSQDETSAKLFFNFVGEFKELVDNASCTPTHLFLRKLDERGQLLRCYSQNIDCLEEQAGLATSFRDKISTTKEPEGENTKGPRLLAEQRKRATRRSAPESPRAVQLHGNLAKVVCTRCRTRRDFDATVISAFKSGLAPEGADCCEHESARSAAGLRPKGVGIMRPDVVLYNEFHPFGVSSVARFKNICLATCYQIRAPLRAAANSAARKSSSGQSPRKPLFRNADFAVRTRKNFYVRFRQERIGDISTADIRNRPDLLLVMGTSLKVPGVRRLIKEMSRAVRATQRGRTVLVNREPPADLGCWASVFDYLVLGDADAAVDAFEGKLDGLLRAPAEVPRGEEKGEDDDDFQTSRARPHVRMKSHLGGLARVVLEGGAEKFGANPQPVSPPPLPSGHG